MTSFSICLKLQSCLILQQSWYHLQNLNSRPETPLQGGAAAGLALTHCICLCLSLSWSCGVFLVHPVVTAQSDPCALCSRGGQGDQQMSGSGAGRNWISWELVKNKIFFCRVKFVVSVGTFFCCNMKVLHIYRNHTMASSRGTALIHPSIHFLNPNSTKNAVYSIDWIFPTFNTNYYFAHQL